MDLNAAAQRVARYALRRRGFQTLHVDTSVGRVHAYAADGKGISGLPTVVVLHGMCSSGAAFARMLVGLRKHARRVIAPEMPGHGFSDAPTAHFTPERLEEAMGEAIDLLVPAGEKLVLCGNSLGGAVALGYAIERPERVDRLVLLSPGGARMEEEELRAVLDRFHLRTTKEARELLATIYHAPPWFMPAFAPGLVAASRSRAVRDFITTVTPDHSPTPDELARLTMPILLVWGKSERLLPESNLAWFKRHLPSHAVIEEPDALGHCAHLDDPDGMVERIVRFARRTA